MKKDIHPKYYENIEITCSCGAKYIAGSTKENLKTELCSACHPFFTGQSRLIDTAGRVDKFMAKRKATEEIKKKREDEKKQAKEKAIVDRLEELVEKRKTTAEKTAKAKTSKRKAIKKTTKKSSKK